VTDEMNNSIDEQSKPGNEVADGAALEQADTAAPVGDGSAPTGAEFESGEGRMTDDATVEPAASPESTASEPTEEAPREPAEAEAPEERAETEAESPDEAEAPPKPAEVEAPPEEPVKAETETPPEPEAPTEHTKPAEVAETPPEEPVASGEETEAGKQAEQAEAPAEEEPKEEEKSDQMDWYILKVQSNREDSIREGLLRRVKIAGLERFFGDVIVPTEKVTEVKGGKKRVMKRKLYPGYIVVNMEVNDDTWFLVRETSGIGDFTGAAGNPTPMAPHEVAKIVAKEEEKAEKSPSLKIGFNLGDRVKIVDGNFENFEGDVEHIDQTNGRVTVMINIFNRSTPVTLEYWQIEAV
jgi:transcriptional antiterminator NusG